MGRHAHVQRAVQEAATGTAGTVLLDRVRRVASSRKVTSIQLRFQNSAHHRWWAARRSSKLSAMKLGRWSPMPTTLPSSRRDDRLRSDERLERPPRLVVLVARDVDLREDRDRPTVAVDEHHSNIQCIPIDGLCTYRLESARC